MLPLVETIIGFSVIMLTLSFLVKSLTSVVKNHVDYYSRNLRAEVDRFLCGIVGRTTAKLPKMRGIQWGRLSDEFLSKENMEWWLRTLGMHPEKVKQELESMEARVEVHKANLRYAFAKRTNTIALAMGLALCLLMNINAFTIWERLYSDQDARAKFSSPEAVEAAVELAEKREEEIKNLESQMKNTEEAAAEAEGQDEEDRAQKVDNLRQEREELLEQIAHFRGEVSFGIGRIWTETPTEDEARNFLLFEFFGSLLTGILVSIGAPYWHDLLSNLVSARKLLPKASAGGGGGK